METHKSLLEATLAVMRDVPYVQMTGWVDHGKGYSVTTERDVISGLHDAMVRHGIVGPIPIETEVRELPNYAARSSEMHRTAVIRTFMFMHVHSKESATVQVAGEAADGGDKSIPKAMTLAKKYALREYFLLETGDDPDYEVASRTSPNKTEFRTCANAINSAKDEARLKELADKVENTPEAAFDSRQREHLHRLISERRDFLKGHK